MLKKLWAHRGRQVQDSTEGQRQRLYKTGVRGVQQQLGQRAQQKWRRRREEKKDKEKEENEKEKEEKE